MVTVVWIVDGCTDTFRGNDLVVGRAFQRLLDVEMFGKPLFDANNGVTPLLGGGEVPAKKCGRVGCGGW